MCRCLYKVLLATLLSLACRQARAERLANAPQYPAHEREFLLDQRSTVDLRLRNEQREHRRYSVAGPVVLGAIGVPLFVGCSATASVLYMFRTVSELDETYSAEEQTRVHRFLYAAGVGAALALSAAGWLTYVIRHRRVHSSAIKELTQQRHQLDARLLQLNQQRAPSPQLTIAPLLSHDVQGLSLALTF